MESRKQLSENESRDRQRGKIKSAKFTPTFQIEYISSQQGQLSFAPLFPNLESISQLKP